MQLANTTAVVTGAGSGLGEATAKALVEIGATVIGIDLPSQIHPGVTRSGVNMVAADVTDQEQVKAALAHVPSDRALRLVVNCAGIAPAQRLISSQGIHDLDVFSRALGVNVIGTFNLLRLGAGIMSGNPVDQDGNRGLVINTASIAAFDGQVGQVAYAASKAAIAGMTLPAARDLARHAIRVNTIAPGVVGTPLMTGFGDEIVDSLAAMVPFPPRLARPDEFAELVLMIAAHDYLNAETIRMDGALRMPPQ